MAGMSAFARTGYEVRVGIVGPRELVERAMLSGLPGSRSDDRGRLFVLLGLLVDPSELAGEVVPAIVVGLVLLLIARPLSVVGSLAGFSVPWREQLFLSWAGLRGAVPIVLATFLAHWSVRFT